MTILTVYKNLDITNAEMIEALQKLGFKEKTGRSKSYWMVNEERQSDIRIPRKPLLDFILKADTATFSYLLHQQGIIKEYDDLVKMIEKDRLEKQKQEKNTPLPEAA
jgi:hypothetical protein